DHIGITFAEPPYSLDLVLQSAVELRIYDCNFPFAVALDGRSATIHAGVNPGRSIDIALTVPADFSARMVAKAGYLEPTAAYRLADGSSPRPGRFLVSASTQIPSGAGQ
ncbi:MAG TPA: hypothetical protein VFL04_05845, partial [Rectinemataceae bacterium]|nr:hypothetical protein [Rectinemataceae bacterium]